ncbi:MAG: hypothetical protein ACE5NG_16865 [bacterium]
MFRIYLRQIQKEFSHVRPYEEDDLEWYNEGLDLLEQGKLTEAEINSNCW